MDTCKSSTIIIQSRRLKKKNEESENSDGGEQEDEAGSDRLDIYGEASVGVRLERTRVTELFLEIFHYLTVAQMMLLHA